MERKELDKIRLLGNFVHNNKVLAANAGELKVVRRPGGKAKPNPFNYFPMLHCHGFIHGNLSICRKWKGSSSLQKEDWQELATICLTRMIVFNKQRSGEAPKLRVDVFNSRPDWSISQNKDISSSLSPQEKELCKK